MLSTAGVDGLEMFSLCCKAEWFQPIHAIGRQQESMTVPSNTRGHMVVQFVEALRYEPEGHGFISWCCHWNFSLTYFFWLHYGPGVESAFDRKE